VISFLRGGQAAVAASGALFLALAGCRQPTRVEIPTASWPGYEYFHLAHEKRLDGPRGLRITALRFPDLGDIAKAYEQGEVAIAQITTVEAVDICSRVPARCPVVVLVLNESRGGDKVAVRPSIGTIAGLRGRRVGVTPSTLGPYVLSRALARHGMTLADVRIVAMPLEDMGRALGRGEIDGAAFFPPFSDEVLASGEAVEAFSSAEIPGEILDVLAVDPAYYRQNLPVLARLLQVWHEAHQLARRDPQAVDLMAAQEGITAEAFRASEKGLVYTPLADQVPLLAPGGPVARNLEDVMEVQQALGLLRGPVPLPQVSSRALALALR
jgi:NitT/TauT family transport system substrate-binding protein